MSHTSHIPILLEPIVDYLKEPFLNETKPSILIDCTLGGGGHTQAFLNQIPLHHQVLSIDQDMEAIERASTHFKSEIESNRLILVHSRFSDLAKILTSLERPVLGLMADFGFSSDQLDKADRGLSFLKDGPLDMRLDQSSGVTAYEFLKKIREDELVKVLSEYGEERFSRRIASAIILAKKSGDLPKTTLGLARLIESSVPPPARHGRIHAATRSFQAIRIAINGEISEIDELLTRGILGLQTGARVAFLSFHSLEDRRVKETLKNKELWSLFNKKPIEAQEKELALNPRARSAKLRMAEKK